MIEIISPNSHILKENTTKESLSTQISNRSTTMTSGVGETETQKAKEELGDLQENMP